MMDNAQKRTQRIIDEHKHRIEIMEAFLEGKALQRRDRTTFVEDDVPDWGRIEKPLWQWDTTDYRITPVAADFIDWSHVHSKYKYMARDKQGKTHLYQYRPICDHAVWRANAGSCVPTDAFVSVVVGNTGWKESLVERPSN